MANKNSTSAVRIVANGFSKEQASEALPTGPLAGGNPGSDPVVPVVGTIVVLGLDVPPPSD